MQPDAVDRQTIERLLDLSHVIASSGLESHAPEPLRFGDVAVALAHVTREQVQEALEAQAADRLADRPHRLVGQILVDLGYLSEAQRLEVVDSLVEQVRGRTGARLVSRLR